VWLPICKLDNWIAGNWKLLQVPVCDVLVITHSGEICENGDGFGIGSIYLAALNGYSVLRFFRVNDPYRLLAILVVLAIFSIPLFLDTPMLTVQSLRSMLVGENIAAGKRMYTEVCDSTAPMSALAFGAVDFMMGRSVIGREIFAVFLLFFQAAFFSILLINNRAYNDNTYVPGLVFGILCFISFDFLEFSPELLGSTMLLLALNNLFREVEFRVQRDETIFSLGVYLGVASTFVFSYTVFLFAALLVLLIFTRLSLRKAILLFMGFLFPHVVIIVLYFNRGEMEFLWRNYYMANLTWGSSLISFGSIIRLAIIPLVYFVFSLFMLTREARFTKYQSQLFQVMFVWMLFSLVEVALTREMTPHSFITTIPCLTYFFSHYLLLIRRKWIAETMLWLLIVGVLTMSYLARQNVIDTIDYSGMFVKDSPYARTVRDKRVMVLGDDLPLYAHNQLGGYFLEWRISRQVVENTDYYDNVIYMHEQFLRDKPEVIIDNNNLFPQIAARIPALKDLYVKENGVYVLK
jgi:hypothetical protein